MAREQDESPAIRTENLSKIYGRGQLALNGLNLAVAPGTVLGVLGPNGAGKTTLVKLLLGLQRPTAGKVWVLGSRMGPQSGLLRQQIGYVPSELRFPSKMSPIDYLDWVGKLSGMSKAPRKARAGLLLRATDLIADASRPIRVLSSGMRTRLAIAASLIHDPPVLIWDEPSQGLDPDSRRSMIELVSQLAESKTIVLCSHYVSDVEQVCTAALVLDQGQVVFQGNPSDLTKGALPSRFEIGLRGDKKEIAEAYKSIQKLEELAECRLLKTSLEIRIEPDTSHATALANVLVTLADHHIEMSDLRLTGGASPSSLTTLLKEENSRGLTRAHQPAQAA